MGRKVIIVSNDNDFVVATKGFCEGRGGQVKVFSPSEWTRNANSPGFAHSLTGEVPPLSAGHQPVAGGAKILNFPSGNGAQTQSAAGADGRVKTMDELESNAIIAAIYQFRGNLTEAAKALGIGRATLYRKVKQYNINPSEARRRSRAA